MIGESDVRDQRLRKQDIGERRRQLDVAHALAAHLGQCHLHAAFLTNEALVLHALVLAAQALVVLDGTKDPRTEKTVTLGLKGAVVDRLWLLDLTERP